MRGRAGAVAALALLAGVAACNPRDLAGVACPVLAPGATTAIPRGVALDAFGGVASATGTLDGTGMAAHAFYAPAGTTVRVGVALSGARALVMLYGPRDGHGGFPYCSRVELARSAGERVYADVIADAEAGGEYLAIVATRPGELGGSYAIDLGCVGGCQDAGGGCATLHALGCPDLRCDGDLARDASGCLTCSCRADALCSGARAAGPWGVCVRPGCTCDGAPPAPVCGLDGQTWASACHARCAGVEVAVEGACESVCPALSSCVDPCRGARKLAATTGCPTCECAPAVPEEALGCTRCPLDETPVCGSDGVTYRNRCDARCAGARLLYAASCASSCRRPPEGCHLDCPWGLVLSGAAEGDCLTCTCAGGPSLACLTSIAPWCVLVPGLSEPVTVGASCIGTALGPPEVTMQRGPCGVGCESDATCPAGTACQRFGALEGRCLATATAACGCSAVHAPACGADGATYANACLAACAGQALVHEGACCSEAPPVCSAGEIAPLDRFGCADADAPCGAPPAAECLEGDPLAPACTPEGVGVSGSACAAHATGLSAAPGWCAP